MTLSVQSATNLFDNDAEANEWITLHISLWLTLNKRSKGRGIGLEHLFNDMAVFHVNRLCVMTVSAKFMEFIHVYLFIKKTC